MIVVYYTTVKLQARRHAISLTLAEGIPWPVPSCTNEVLVRLLACSSQSSSTISIERLRDMAKPAFGMMVVAPISVWPLGPPMSVVVVVGSPLGSGTVPVVKNCCRQRPFSIESSPVGQAGTAHRTTRCRREGWRARRRSAPTAPHSSRARP